MLLDLFLVNRHECSNGWHRRWASAEHDEASSRPSEPTSKLADSSKAWQTTNSGGPSHRFSPTTGHSKPISPSAVPSSEMASGRRRKQVGFSPFATAGDGDSLDALKPLPPSRECRSSRSILKPGVPSSPNQEEELISDENLQSLLERVTPEVFTLDISSRMRLYTSLFAVFKTYDGKSDTQQVNEKLQILMGAIKTELSAVWDPAEPARLNLMTQSLKLLGIVAWNPHLSIYLTKAHRSWILDHAIQSLSRPELPKVTILNYLHVLSVQTFGPTLMTTTRAVRLFEVLKDISSRVPGNGVVAQRLLVYHRVLDQAKVAFKKCSLHWPHHLVEAMTSKVPDTRTKALELGTLLANHLPPSPTIAKALRDVLDKDEGGEKFGSNTIKRLSYLLKTADEPHQVPQIWSVVILLLRGLESGFYEWHCLNDWIKLIQKCFNSGNSEIQVRANKAWDKMVYVARPYQDTESFLARMLMKPILIQLERPCTPGHSSTTRASAFSSYCNLLYIALKPPATNAHYDAVWAMYIKPVFAGSFLSDEDNSDRACRILSSLFWKRVPMPWRPGRALETMPVEIEELPLLDFRWIRSCVPAILEVFARLLEKSKWEAKGPYSQSHIATAWENFAKALGEACRKEVIPSAETLSAARHVMLFLTRRPFLGTKATTPQDEKLSIWSFLCGTMFSELGPAVLRAASRAGDVVTPLDIEKERLFSEADFLGKLFWGLKAVQGGHEEAKVEEAVVKILGYTLDSRSSCNHKIGLYRSSCEWLMGNLGGAYPRLVWQATMKLVSEVISSAVDAHMNGEEILQFCLDLREILYTGSAFGEASSVLLLLKTYLLIATRYDNSQTAVDGLEEVLEASDNQADDIWATLTLDKLLPLLRPEEKAKRIERSLPVFGQIVVKTDLILERHYLENYLDREGQLSDLVGTILTILRGSSVDLSCAFLTGIKQSLFFWLTDDNKVFVKSAPVGALKLAQAQRLWTGVIETLGRLAGRINLDALDNIVESGLSSAHKVVRKDMVQMWERSYRSQDIGYGPRSRRALGILTPAEMEQKARLQFLPSDGMNAGFAGAVPTTTKEMAKVATKAKPSVKDTREKVKSRRSRKHDDSQINFVPIHSSPRVERLESQDLTTRQKEVRDKQSRSAPIGLATTRSPSRQLDIETDLAPLGNVHSADPQLETVGDVPSPLLNLAALEDVHSSSPQADTTTPVSLRQKSYEDAIRTTPTPKSKDKHSQDVIGQPDLPPPPKPADRAVDKETAMEVDEPKGPTVDLQILHSDDNDFWSASQLSEDLRQVVGPSPTMSTTKGSPSTLKRRRSSSSEQAKKKTKASPSQSASKGNETEQEEGDLSLVASSPTLRKATEQAKNGRVSSLQHTLATNDSTTPGTALPDQMEDIASSSPSLKGLPDPSQDHSNTEENAVSLLERALATLRNGDIFMDRSSLRTVEDLLFEIRSEAQNVTQRGVSD